MGSAGLGLNVASIALAVGVEECGEPFWGAGSTRPKPLEVLWMIFMVLQWAAGTLGIYIEIFQCYGAGIAVRVQDPRNGRRVEDFLYLALRILHPDSDYSGVIEAGEYPDFVL